MSLTDQILFQDERAVTSDGLSFSITFGEFKNVTRMLSFTEDEANLPEDERNEIVRTRYNALREELFITIGRD